MSWTGSAPKTDDIETGRGAFGQFNTGEIAGVVADRTGAVLPGVEVHALHNDSGFAIDRVTDGSGRFFLPSLPPAPIP